MGGRKREVIKEKARKLMKKGRNEMEVMKRGGNKVGSYEERRD